MNDPRRLPSLPSHAEQPIEMVDTLSTDIVNSLDGKPTDVAVMSCLESAIRVIKMTTGLTTVGAIDVLIDCLSKARVEEDKIPLEETFNND